MTPLRPPTKQAATQTTVVNNTCFPSAQPAVKPGDTPPRSDRAPGWHNELQKFLRVDVEIDYEIGDKAYTVSGRMVAIYDNSVHCIVDTGEESIFIRIPLRIRRARKHAKVTKE